MAILPSGTDSFIQAQMIKTSTDNLALQATNSALLSNENTANQMQRQQEAAKTDAAVAMLNSSNKRTKDIQM